ncbi:MAG: homoserine dehydrogenase [Oscillospiraceae bacterium]|nr:homoserine dehydrogenase [Candidatus Equicaccousia limihippi]
MIYCAILGHGVVGSGVAEILLSHKESIKKKAKREIDIKYILDIRDFPSLPYSNLFTKDFNVILNDPEVRVVAEVMGGVNPAFDFVKSCLQKGKSVVTSNKELVAAKGAQLLKIAKENNVNFLFEASVGGGIPVLRPIAQCLAANDLYEISGILNGTTNFILTKMETENMPFDKALQLAQQLGYAEKDPSADIDGHDACRKICILASLAFGKHVYPTQVVTEGIRDITLTEKEYASLYGGAIKLIGQTKLLDGGKITASVHPTVVSYGNQLSHVNDVFNAVMVSGDAVGDVMFYGRGAGKLPTASAVVADLIDCVKHIEARKYLFWEDGSEDYVVDESQNSAKFLICLRNRQGLKEEIIATFGNIKFIARDGGEDEICFATERAGEGELMSKLDSLKATIIFKLHILD